ncbi:MAG: hypothetical protein ACE5K0_04310 [Candidatus Methanofastidiosia archaeon]
MKIPKGKIIEKGIGGENALSRFLNEVSKKDFTGYLKVMESTSEGFMFFMKGKISHVLYGNEGDFFGARCLQRIFLRTLSGNSTLEIHSFEGVLELLKFFPEARLTQKAFKDALQTFEENKSERLEKQRPIAMKSGGGKIMRIGDRTSLTLKELEESDKRALYKSKLSKILADEEIEERMVSDSKKALQDVRLKRILREKRRKTMKRKKVTEKPVKKPAEDEKEESKKVDDWEVLREGLLERFELEEFIKKKKGIR